MRRGTVLSVVIEVEGPVQISHATLAIDASTVQFLDFKRLFPRVTSAGRIVEMQWSSTSMRKTCYRIWIQIGRIQNRWCQVGIKVFRC